VGYSNGIYDGPGYCKPCTGKPSDASYYLSGYETKIVRSGDGKFCKAGEDITTEAACKGAAKTWDLTYAGSINDPSGHRYCFTKINSQSTNTASGYTTYDGTT
jgi:hypothetical protein